jgi:hypothetical protein
MKLKTRIAALALLLVLSSLPVFAALKTQVMNTFGDGGVSNGATITFEYDDVSLFITKFLITVAGQRADGTPKNIHIHAVGTSPVFTFDKDYLANPDGTAKSYTEILPSNTAPMYTLVPFKGQVTIQPNGFEYTIFFN